MASLYARMATTNYQEATMATATKAPSKAKKATREFWISRGPGSYYVQVWSGKAQPQISTEPRNNCPYCTDPNCEDNQPSNDFVQPRGERVTSECVSEFRRTTGISVKEGEALLVRMTVVKRR